ncbi:MAG: type II toxin-antitoxin system RelE/ParE family toxin [Cyanobacteria bacterium P01_H01_bin.21]
MTSQFRLTKPAVKDIEQIADYIAQKSGLEQAEQFLEKLDSKFAKIAQFPKLGRQRNEVLPNLRSLSLDSYLILYMPIDQNIDILRVVSGYRDLSALFDD